MKFYSTRWLSSSSLPCQPLLSISPAFLDKINLVSPCNSGAIHSYRQTFTFSSVFLWILKAIYIARLLFCRCCLGASESCNSKYDSISLNFLYKISATTWQQETHLSSIKCSKRGQIKILELDDPNYFVVLAWSMPITSSSYVVCTFLCPGLLMFLDASSWSGPDERHLLSAGACNPNHRQLRYLANCINVYVWKDPNSDTIKESHT